MRYALYSHVSLNSTSTVQLLLKIGRSRSSAAAAARQHRPTGTMAHGATRVRTAGKRGSGSAGGIFSPQNHALDGSGYGGDQFTSFLGGLSEKLVN